MSLRNILLVTGAFAFLLGVSLLGLWLSQSPTRTQQALRQAPVQQQQQREILVAARIITTGTLLRPEDMTWKAVTAISVGADMLVRGQVATTDFVGAVARRDFHIGEPLVREALVQPSDRGFLAAVLTPGDRAVSISVSAAQSSAGLLMPGDHVDVILTQTFAPDATTPPQKTVGETVLRDIRVIAVGQTMSALARPQPSDKSLVARKLEIPKTITLEVTPRDAEKLFVATQLGKIELAVRALDGSTTTPIAAEAPTWAYDVSPALKELRSAGTSKGQPGGVAAGPQVQVMHGAKIEMR